MLIEDIRPAPGAGRLTPEQLQTAAWRHYGERVLLGAGLLDQKAGGEGMHSAGWRRLILEVPSSGRLQMYNPSQCLIATLYLNDWLYGCEKLGLNGDADFGVSPEAYLLGFNTCTGTGTAVCDPVAHAYREDPENPGGECQSPFAGLREAWLMYISATVDLF